MDHYLPKIFVVPFLLATLFLNSCQHKSKTISFYYWKTSFHLNPEEVEAIKYNQVSTIYTRYCDIDFAPGDAKPKPISPIQFDTSTLFSQIIPVIYIKNRVFEKLDTAGILLLCQNISKLTNGINQSIRQSPSEIQFDCDWTENTKDNYFLFLRRYKAMSGLKISATIRLHQVKYPERTGIPPVDYGVLMYYNMGEINAGENSSIYEKSIAEKYNAFIKNYPLRLDAALPIFSWSQLVSEGKVMKLLNKMNFMDFENDSNFTTLKKGWFSVKHSCFHEGYYFKETDQVKIEQVSEKDLMDIIEQLNKHASKPIQRLIFYDLDKTNLQLYEKDIFKKMVAHLD